VVAACVGRVRVDDDGQALQEHSAAMHKACIGKPQPASSSIHGQCRVRKKTTPPRFGSAAESALNDTGDTNSMEKREKLILLALYKLIYMT